MTSPNSGNLNDTVIRADGRGRLLVRAQQRAAILKAFDKSSMSAMAFCRQHGLSYSTFATWIQRRRREQSPHAGSVTTGKPAFAEVVVDEGKSGPKAVLPLRVTLRSGISFEVVSAEQLPLVVGLIQSLAASRPC